jgi:hypothetical protein
LLNVVQENQMQGVDPAAVTFDAGQSRQDRLKERRTEQNVELYGAGGERQDIAEAADRMGWTFGGRRELKKLPEHLFDNETVRFIAQGAYLGKQGIAVLTNQRLLFVFHGFMSQSIEDFPLDRISSVASKAGMVRGDLKVHASGNDAVISNIVKEDLKFLADALRQRLSEGANGKLGTSGPQQQPDLMDQLRKLAELRDAGILTPDEFEAKKADILSRL